MCSVVFSDGSTGTAVRALLGGAVLSTCLEDLPVVTSVGDTGEAVHVSSLRTHDVEMRGIPEWFHKDFGLSPNRVAVGRGE